MTYDDVEVGPYDYAVTDNNVDDGPCGEAVTDFDTTVMLGQKMTSKTSRTSP